MARSAASKAQVDASSFASLASLAHGMSLSYSQAALRMSNSTASSLASDSASGNWTPWFMPIGRPKTRRCLAYSTTRRIATRPMPRQPPATMMRSALSPASRYLKPRPSSPISAEDAALLGVFHHPAHRDPPHAETASGNDDALGVEPREQILEAAPLLADIGRRRGAAWRIPPPGASRPAPCRDSLRQR